MTTRKREKTSLYPEPKIRLGISSCLLGNNVRYDGGHKLDHYLRDTLGQVIEWIPVCAEVESGLTVPREPMCLVRAGGAIRLVTLETKVDQSHFLKSWMPEKMKYLAQAGIRGFVFKARSPSCGVNDAEIFTESGKKMGKGTGLFAAAILRYFGSIPVADEERLRNISARENFIERVLLLQSSK